MAQLVITSVERAVLAMYLVMCFQSRGVCVVMETKVEPLLEQKVGPLLELKVGPLLDQKVPIFKGSVAETSLLLP